MRSLLPLLFLLPACGETDEPAPDEPVAEDVGEAPPVGNYFEDEGYMLPASHVNVVRRIAVSTLIEEGVALGFDLDGRTSDYTDEESCLQGDLKGPDGSEGIDNQLAVIWGALEPLVGEAVNALLQGAINEGRVLLMMELTGVDDLYEDDDTTFNLYRGLLDPEIGTQGLIAPSQTFYYDYGSPISTVEGVVVEDGVFVAGPVKMQLPLDILDLQIIAELHGAWARITIAEDGTFTGYLGGAFSLPQLLGALMETGAAAEARLVAPIFRNNADMGRDEDGICQLISVGFEFEGTTAYVVRDRQME